MTDADQAAWHKIDPGTLEVGRVTTVVVAGRALCITRTGAGYGVLDNHCPHQSGPLGDGGIDQDVLMSGYLGSIGFAFPAAMGA